MGLCLRTRLLKHVETVQKLNLVPFVSLSWQRSFQKRHRLSYCRFFLVYRLSLASCLDHFRSALLRHTCEPDVVVSPGASEAAALAAPSAPETSCAAVAVGLRAAAAVAVVDAGGRYFPKAEVTR